jgi:EAL domain-containing protein (putative c-di-GMP-specific phosphodiesterase class I)
VRFHVARAARRPIEMLELEARLRRALERGEFMLHYQPKVNATSRAITGLEALLRWHPTGRAPVAPSQFIPIAEESGLIVPIGRWALREACAQQAAWRRAGLAPPPVAVNVSPRQFLDSSLLAVIDGALADNAAEGSSLQLEVTEGMMMRDVAHAIATLGEIRRRGIGVAIDDFGTGYSSMSLMKTFPIDTLKIDRSFVRGLPLGPEDRAIVRAIIRMGKALGLRLVAEGVETLGQADFLRQNHCDELQGFLFGRPIAGDLVPALLAASWRGEPAAARSRRVPELRETA